MQTKTLTIKRNQTTLVVILQNSSREREKKARELFYTTLEQLEKIMSVPSAVVKEELRKKNPLVGTPAGALKAYRLRQGLTQAGLARKAGLKQHHISEMEKGKRGIGLKSAKTLAKALNCKFDQLLS